MDKLIDALIVLQLEQERCSNERIECINSETGCIKSEDQAGFNCASRDVETLEGSISYLKRRIHVKEAQEYAESLVTK